MCLTTKHATQLLSVGRQKIWQSRLGKKWLHSFLVYNRNNYNFALNIIVESFLFVLFPVNHLWALVDYNEIKIQNWAQTKRNLNVSHYSINRAILRVFYSELSVQWSLLSFRSNLLTSEHIRLYYRRKSIEDCSLTTKLNFVACIQAMEMLVGDNWEACVW